MTTTQVFTYALDSLEQCREAYKRQAMDAKLSVDDRMAAGHKAHRLREIICRLRKNAAEFYED